MQALLWSLCGCGRSGLAGLCPSPRHRSATPTAILFGLARVGRAGRAYIMFAVTPPSTKMIWPETKSLAGEARNTAVPAISSGCA